ncbi:MAG TPA: glycosyltransferase family A protein [Bacteroidales bacterium]|nr:glycosyltransferase family A protein [Bacteroidales bacterium]
MTRKKERNKMQVAYSGKKQDFTEAELNELPYIPMGGLNLFSTKDLKKVLKAVKEDFFVLFLKPELPSLGEHALERLVQVAEDSGAGIVYSNYQEIIGGVRKNHPVNDYQIGSIRDDFDFGPLLLIRTSAAKESLVEKDQSYESAGWYDLRLKISQKYPIIHLDENLYTIEETDLRDSDEKMFAYVDPKNRIVQVEMEEACTNHLKNIGAWLPPYFETVDLKKGSFPVEASVIIPVRNRIKTISDAIRSVLEQVADFKFNLIIVDNHSTDGTSNAIAKFAAIDKRIIHITPERQDLGIGGCWNVGVQHPECGRFAIQLDSDDVYSGVDTLQKIVAAFYEQNCAMLVGTYRMCNVKLETIPPGIIDHKEWTEANGRNNALRINGLGAPRAFFTPALRIIKVPNTSYGEDYALGLQFSRRWRIGRIYEVLYLCRRWEDNSDASIDIVRLNANNAYKDKLRSIEIAARQKQNA